MLEGVTKFHCRHADEPVRTAALERAAELLAWRTILFDLGLVGQDPQRYDGAGYGNLSARVGAPSSPRGGRAFVITGTQTGGQRTLDPQRLAEVMGYRLADNAVASRGLVRPSSESLTHGALYDLSPVIRWVFHVHSPVIWQHAEALRLPITAPDVGYGTVEMAHEVARLYRDSVLSEIGVLAMAGHQDGIIAYGKTAREASGRLLGALAQAVERAALAGAGSRRGGALQY